MSAVAASVEPSGLSVVRRHPIDVRIAHWIAAVSFILLALTGLGLFFPGIFFTTIILGGGQMARLLHPWIGVALAVSYLWLFLRFVGSCLWGRDDTTWISRLGDAMAGREENLPEVGKFNAGQKLYFWGMLLLIIILLVTGIFTWQAYFATAASVDTQRLAVLIHSIAAILAILGFLIHLHMVLWEPGTLRSMVAGTVTGGWAWKHHRKWLRERVAGRG
jgi:formate dehydrogenase subunit gamma